VRIILLRHGQSLGNVDELAYCRIPDHALPLTDLGEREARVAGGTIKELIGDGPVAAYVSPYKRTRRTFDLLGVDAERVVTEPRVREQDWGNLQDPTEQEVLKHQRHAFGHFFFRLPNGESGADVDDRVAAFLDGLQVRLHEDETHPKTVLIVSHDWSIELFESLSNVDTCENRVLDHDGTGWKLDRPFVQWRDSPDGTVQLPG
jgi:broad specificity phosphatase PhoE